jgi:hypothetical protein
MLLSNAYAADLRELVVNIGDGLKRADEADAASQCLFLRLRGYNRIVSV